MTHAVVTGAGGFIGSVLARQLLRDGIGSRSIDKLTLVDLRLIDEPWLTDQRINVVTGSIAEAAVQAACTAADVDVVFHLASLPGGAAEKNYELGRQINFDATLALIDALGQHAVPRRFVYASSIAVYGEFDAEVLYEGEVQPRPALSYGTHKLACELFVSDATRRGKLIGCSLRLPGVVARPGDGEGLISAFMSQIFWRLAAGEPLTVPVSRHGKTWWISAQACAANLRHAAMLSYEQLAARNAFQMPALHLSCEQVAQEVADRSGTQPDLIDYQPVETIDKLFARYPALSTLYADAAGFVHDGSVQRLVKNALEHP